MTFRISMQLHLYFAFFFFFSFLLHISSFVFSGFIISWPLHLTQHNSWQRTSSMDDMVVFEGWITRGCWKTPPSGGLYQLLRVQRKQSVAVLQPWEVFLRWWIIQPGNWFLPCEYRIKGTTPGIINPESDCSSQFYHFYHKKSTSSQLVEIFQVWLEKCVCTIWLLIKEQNKEAISQSPWNVILL